jgi:hypothetical protein
MGPQIEVQRESLETELTLERFLSSMHQLMPLQLGVVQELLPTTFYRANILALTMCHEMLS